MVIQHNLTAINANRMGGMTVSSRAKSAEKLASGYKINRAADDAAGLSISEKMRRQVRGLSRAVKNGKDGISFVQIADGALHEVHDMLQRGNELCVQAANGTLSESDRRDINNEIVQLKKEIDSITSRTKFNETQIFSDKGVFPRTFAVTPTKAQEAATDALAKKIAEELFPNAVNQIVSKITSLGDKLKSLANANPSGYETKLDIKYIDGEYNILATMGAAGGGGTFALGSLTLTVDEADFPDLNISADKMQTFESTIAHEVMHGVMFAVDFGRMTSRSETGYPDWFIEGTAQLSGGGYTTGWNDTLKYKVKNLSDASDNSKDSEIKDYLSQGGNYTVDTRVYGHGYLASAYASYLAADGDDVSQSNLLNGINKIFNAMMDNPSESFNNVMAAQMGVSVDDLKAAIDSGSETEIKPGKMSAVEFVRRLTYNSLGGAGSYVTDALNTGGTDILKDTADAESQPMRITQIKTSYESLLAEPDDNTGHYDSITLHVGTDADMTNKIEVLQYDMSTEALKLTDTNVLTMENATNAINDFGAAIMMVSGVRSYFGAIQNRLEHTILNLDNVVENTTASESRLRDTDMADEMVKLSAFNILQQAGDSMLAQANQSTQGVMSLLQG